MSFTPGRGGKGDTRGGRGDGTRKPGGGRAFDSDVSGEGPPGSDRRPRGEVMAFDEEHRRRELPVPVPRLPRMDDVLVSRASFRLTGVSVDHDVAAPGPAIRGTYARVTLPGVGLRPPGTLGRLVIEDLAAAPTLDIPRIRLTAGNTTVSWRMEGGRVTRHWGTPEGGEHHHLHLLVRPVLVAPAGSATARPPVAAVPACSMPGGDDLYGPALGGARLSLGRGAGDQVRATITLDPPLALAAVQLEVRAGKTAPPHDQIPSQLRPVSWSAREVSGTFTLRPAGLRIVARADGEDAADWESLPEVAALPGEVPELAVEVDFAPVARSLLRASLKKGRPRDPDLGLRLGFESRPPAGGAGVPGSIRVTGLDVDAVYLHHPLPEAGRAVSLRGAVETLDLGLPRGLRPDSLAFTVVGRYGPAVLVAAADDPLPPAARSGWRVAGPHRVARGLTLTEAEAACRLVRIGLFGRASGEPAEVLVSFHRGDAARLGTRLGAPVTLVVPPAADPAWHRAELPPDVGSAPHPGLIWTVVQVGKGAFWWYADPGRTGAVLRGADDGATWSAVAMGSPGLQLHVARTDLDGRPCPLHPLGVRWNEGLLAADVVGVGDGAPVRDAFVDFRRTWEEPEEGGGSTMLARLSGLPGPLRLSFECRRDVDLRLADTVLTYDPWRAKEGE